MGSAKEYVKRFTTVPVSFVDELFEMISESTRQSDIVIDLEKIAQWLLIRKSSIMRTLKESYVLNVDYTIRRERNPKNTKYGSNRWNNVKVSPTCFKELAMRSNSKNSALVRMYLLQVEDAFISYRTQTMEGMKRDIHTLLNNQKPTAALDAGQRGYVYMIRMKDGVTPESAAALGASGSTASREEAVKIGMTRRTLGERLKGYNTGFADNADVLFQVQTDDVVAVERCIKALAQPKQYRGQKEVYMIDVDIMKKVIDGCARGAAEVRRVPGPRRQSGGFYAVVMPVVPS